MTVRPVPVEAWVCPRCKVEPAGRAYYGPCSDCARQLREIADDRFRGWLLVRFFAALNGREWP